MLQQASSCSFESAVWVFSVNDVMTSKSSGFSSLFSMIGVCSKFSSESLLSPPLHGRIKLGVEFKVAEEIGPPV